MDLLPLILTNTLSTTALLGGITWFAKTWISERLSRSIKHKYDLDLEQYKSNLASSNALEIEKFKATISTEYELIKVQLLRYSEKQFDLYNDMWASLCNLEVCVIDLWEIANLSNLKMFARQLHNTRLKVRKSALLIEDIHYKQLNSVLKEFEGFSFGKRKLIDLRNAQRDANVSDAEIKNVILNNAEIKDRLVHHLTEMMACLKKQIVEPSNTNTTSINFHGL